MKTRSLPVLILLAAAPVCWLHAADTKESAQDVLKKLKGKWKMDRMEVNGKENPQANRMGAVISGKVITLTQDGRKTNAAKLVLNPSKDPATVNWTWGSGVAAGTTALGIYRLKDDTLEICMNQSRGAGSNKRPTKFTTKPDVGSGSILYVLKKDK
jgi:uncharacterized protein (TIGR03067 family)